MIKEIIKFLFGIDFNSIKQKQIDRKQRRLEKEKQKILSGLPEYFLKNNKKYMIKEWCLLGWNYNDFYLKNKNKYYCYAKYTCLDPHLYKFKKDIMYSRLNGCKYLFCDPIKEVYGSLENIPKG